jgi:hypothetical protein
MRTFRPPTWAAPLATSVLVACATASPQDNGSHSDARPPDADVIGGRPDAPPVPDAMPGAPDASPPDAMVSMPDGMVTAGTVTMSETTSSSDLAGNSVGCNQSGTFYTTENSYYRAYRPSDYGVSGALHITRVDFGVDDAETTVGSQTVTVKVYNYSGALGGTNLDLASMALLGSTTVSVPDTTTGENVSANVAATVPAGANVVVEILVPDGRTAGNIFFIGSNTSGETMPSYVRAPDCTTDGTTPISTPTSFAVLGVTVDILLTATGSYP